MGQHQSKEELLYEQVKCGNIGGIKNLHSDGAGLEWVDKEGKTPLMVACMNPELCNVAKTLIDLGANVNAYCAGRQAGTPLHHAAKRGHEQTVNLLLSNGANALMMNDDFRTPVDIARFKGWGNVVRAIEGQICLFSGWMREFYGPAFLELLAPQLLSRKVWVVVLPCGSRNLSKPCKLELAIYTNPQDAKPRTVIALWKARLEELNINQADPAVVISVVSNMPRRWRRRRGLLSSEEARCRPQGFRQYQIKLAPAKVGDKQQLQGFCNAWKGISEVKQPSYPFQPQVPAEIGPSNAGNLELAMAISASQRSDTEDRPQKVTTQTVPVSNAHANTSVAKQNNSAAMETDAPVARSAAMETDAPVARIGSIKPAADHIDSQNDSPVIRYPLVDSTPVDLSSPDVQILPNIDDGKEKYAVTCSSCVICLDAPVEGACIPCGHMSGCMSCLSEINEKKWGCPVCRANIDQVIRLYAV